MGVNKEECARCGGNKEYEEGMCSLENSYDASEEEEHAPMNDK